MQISLKAVAGAHSRMPAGAWRHLFAAMFSCAALAAPMAALLARNWWRFMRFLLMCAMQNESSAAGKLYPRHPPRRQRFEDLRAGSAGKSRLGASDVSLPAVVPERVAHWMDTSCL